jgi:ornithine cyclodeaminase/alanine dehydrogenase-like protein (mu-crystallin family)
MEEVVRTCEQALAEMGQGGAVLSVPPAMFLEGDKAPPVVFKVKGGHLRSLNACGFRVVGDVGEGGALGEAHFCYLVDPETAAPRALVAHTVIHRMRTAACGMIALKTLAPSKADTFALIGAGKIGSHFAAGFGEVFQGKRLLIASRSRDSAIQLAARAQSKSARVVAAENVEGAMREAQSVVVLTSSASPVLSAKQFKPGLTIIGMGEHHELPVELLKKADRFVVDDIGFARVLGSLGAWIKLGQVTEKEAERRVDATLGSIVAGQEQGRRTDSEKVLCIVQGLAIADIALAELCRRKVLGLA